MDYEKKYKEALERARELYNNPNSSNIGKSYLYTVFHELKESKDERIRKELLESFKYQQRESRTDKEWLNGIKLSEVVAWIEKQGELKETPCDKCKKGLPSHSCQDITALGRCAIEKQGEQKSIFDFNANNWYVSKVDGKIHTIYHSEVGPKFKVGDWITNGEYTWFIEGMHNRFYDIISPEGCGTDDTIIHVDGHFHLWTIEDAKDGDILFQDLMEGKTFIFDGINSDMTILYSFIINNDGKDVLPYDIGKPNTGIGTIKENKNIIHPATKEQRGQLEKAMTDAGYKWDAERKKLKKIEDEEYNGEDYGIDSLFHAQRILEKTLGKVDGYQTDDGILSHKCAITAVKKLYGQKPSWSEEDDYNLQCMIAKVDNDIQNGNVGRNQELIDWLKSIKPRMEEQQ